MQQDEAKRAIRGFQQIEAKIIDVLILHGSNLEEEPEKWVSRVGEDKWAIRSVMFNSDRMQSWIRYDKNGKPLLGAKLLK